MTLLAEIQSVLERTYRPAGVNLEECLIGAGRSRQLSLLLKEEDRELSPWARTYLRVKDETLHLAIYYNPRMIELLEQNDPRQGINHFNIGALIAFIEEITHGVHAALAFQAGDRRIDSPLFACNLELQARVDTYWILMLLCRSLGGAPVSPGIRTWLKERLFGDEETDYQSPALARRYGLAREAAARFVDLCEHMDPASRTGLIREFHGKNLLNKLRLLRRLGG